MHLNPSDPELAEVEQADQFLGLTQQPDQERLLRPGEVARLLNVDPKTVGLWARKGKLPSIRTPGGHHRIPASAIREVMVARNEMTGERWS